MATSYSLTDPEDLRINTFSIQSSIAHIKNVTAGRLFSVLSRVEMSLVSVIAFLPLVAANGVDKRDAEVLGHPSNDTLVVSDVNSLSSPFNFTAWRDRGLTIRNGLRQECFGNLSIALAAAGTAMALATSGAAGALSLLPTAGALIGAPAKELWVLYKLMPLAGVLSMMLSLGGNIVPTSTSDYNVNTKNFSYGGYIASLKETTDGQDDIEFQEDFAGTPAQRFAAKVERRSKNKIIGISRKKIAFGILLQLVWLCILLVACYITAAGGVVSWACQAWFWMYFWYLCVVISAFLENIAGVPFTKQWTMRVSRAPRVRISSDAPIVAMSEDLTEVSVNNIDPSNDEEQQLRLYQQSEGINEIRMCDTAVEVPGSDNPSKFGSLQDESIRVRNVEFESRFVSRTSSGLLQSLEAGHNTNGKVLIDKKEPWAAPRVPFYVIISLEGVSTSHATLRVISKAISVGVFAAGTAAFAFATMITISVALTVLCLVLGAGVFGRVIAMWMASEMMYTSPVLHAVVKNRTQASDLFQISWP